MIPQNLIVRGVSQRVISVSQLGLIKEFKSAGERVLWFREHGFKSFGRVTIREVRHQIWFHPKLIRKDRVKQAFKMEMKNESQNK